MDQQEERNAAARPRFTVPRNVLDAFGSLVTEDTHQQAEAATIILKHAESSQVDHEETVVPDDTAYIVQRLVSGLLSSRPRAREGFYTTLQALLQLQPSTAPLVFLTVTEKCCVNKAFNKDEAKEQVVGELLGYGALIRSGQADGNSEMLSKIICRLFQIKQMKTYTDTMATQFLVQLMEKCEDRIVYKDILNYLEKERNTAVKQLSPCSLWLRLALLKNHRHKFPVWLTSTLNPDNYSAIGHIVMKTTADFPKVHPLVEDVIHRLTCDHHATATNLVKFWVDGLAPYLECPSTGKIQLLFNVLQLLLPKLGKGSEVSAVVSGPLVTLLLTTVSRHDHDLSFSARGLASALLQLVAANQDESSEVQLAVVKALIVPPGSVRFDQLTGTKLLAQMKNNFTLTTIKGLAKVLKMIMLKQIKNVKPADQSCAAHSLKVLMLHPKVSSENQLTWRTRQLKVLMKAALFTSNDSADLQDFRDAFFKTLSNFTGHIKEYKSVLLDIVNVADDELQLHEAAGTSPLDAEAKKLWPRVFKKICVLQGEGEQTSKANLVFQVLYCQMCLHLFIDPSGAKDIIEELNACHKKVMKMSDIKRTKNRGVELQTKEPYWVEVVTELLLTLLTHEKNFIRSVSQGVFWLMCPEMTHTALTLLTDVLDPSKTQELIRKENDDNTMENKNVENMEPEVAEGTEDEETDSENEEDEVQSDSIEEASDDENEMEEDMEVDEENEDGNDVTMSIIDLKKKMLAVTGNIDEDVDMDSVPQEELNNLDRQLSAVMGEYQNKRRDKKTGAIEKLPKDEKSIMHFRTRVCDLIAVYIKKAPSMGMLLGLVNPLFIALYTADQDKRQKDLQSRLRHLINLLGKVKKCDSLGDATIDQLVDNLNTFFINASGVSESFTAVVQECYSLLHRFGSRLLGEGVHLPDNPLVKALASHMDYFFTKSTSSVKVHAFLGPCSYDFGGLWSIMELVAKFAFDSNIKIYRRTQALQVLQKLYENKALLAQGNEEYVSRIEGDISTKIVNTLNSFMTPESINGQYMSSLFTLLVAIHKNHSVRSSQKNFNWQEIKDVVPAIRQCISRKTIKSFRKPYNSLQQALKLPKLVYIIKNLGQSNAVPLPEEYSSENIYFKNSKDTEFNNRKRAGNFEDSKMKKEKRQKQVHNASLVVNKSQIAKRRMKMQANKRVETKA